MGRVGRFLGSSIGKKVVMALTGLILFGFVIVHLLGNLQVFEGPGTLDEYGAALRRFPGILWTLRLTLLAAMLAHIWAATSLTLLNRAARPQAYRERAYREATLASRTMRWTGVILLGFIVYHLLDLTFGSVNPDFIPGAVHHNLVASFQSAPVAAFYVAAMLFLGPHLYHGVWSMTQTLGLSHPRYNAIRHSVAAVITGLIVVGNISIPVAVQTGVIR